MSKSGKSNTNRGKRKNEILRLCVCAMLVGVSVVIGILCREYLTFGSFIRITFENHPIILSGIMFGPAYGLIVGVITDLISCIVTGQDINPIIMVGSAAVGLVAGASSEMCNMLYVNKTFKKIISCVLAHIIGCILIKTFGMKVYFQEISFWYLLGIRSLVYTFICACETSIILLLLKNKYIKGFSNYEL